MVSSMRMHRPASYNEAIYPESNSELDKRLHSAAMWKEDVNINFHRHNMQQSIAKYLVQLKPKAPPGLIASITGLANRLESILLTTASSLEDYKNLHTLKKRLQEIHQYNTQLNLIQIMGSAGSANHPKRPARQLQLLLQQLHCWRSHLMEISDCPASDLVDTPLLFKIAILCPRTDDELIKCGLPESKLKTIGRSLKALLLHLDTKRLVPNSGNKSFAADRDTQIVYSDPKVAFVDGSRDVSAAVLASMRTSPNNGLIHTAANDRASATLRPESKKQRLSDPSSTKPQAHPNNPARKNEAHLVMPRLAPAADTQSPLCSPCTKDDIGPTHDSRHAVLLPPILPTVSFTNDVNHAARDPCATPLSPLSISEHKKHTITPDQPSSAGHMHLLAQSVGHVHPQCMSVIPAGPREGIACAPIPPSIAPSAMPTTSDKELYEKEIQALRWLLQQTLQEKAQLELEIQQLKSRATRRATHCANDEGMGTQE